MSIQRKELFIYLFVCVCFETKIAVIHTRSFNQQRVLEMKRGTRGKGNKGSNMKPQELIEFSFPARANANGNSLLLCYYLPRLGYTSFSLNKLSILKERETCYVANHNSAKTESALVVGTFCTYIYFLCGQFKRKKHTYRVNHRESHKFYLRNIIYAKK